jgi:uncharacterized membrane protein
MFKFLSKKTNTDTIWLFGTMLAFGVIGLISAFVLSVEKVHLLQNPDAILSCSINVVVNCSTVMQTWQASLFGFPNSYIGLMGYSVVITVAVIGLAGVAAQLPRWFWRIGHLAYAAGAAFAYWLFFQSVYVIEVLCPWCLVVTFSTTILLATISRFSTKQNIWNMSKTRHKKLVELLDKDIEKVVVAAGGGVLCKGATWSILVRFCYWEASLRLLMQFG